MAQPRVLILRSPGANCDQEAEHAFRLAGGDPKRVHVKRVLESPNLLDDFQVLCIPGGFSYGDDVAAGRILGNQLRRHLAEAVRRFRDAGKLILGICNGFQVLLKSGILLDDSGDAPAATLGWNDSGHFEDRWVRLVAVGGRSVFFQGIESLYLPIAHAEGKFIPCDQAMLQQLERQGQLALRYAPLGGAAADPTAPLAFPDNPNGAVANVAGVCDTTGRVCGLMPHPERFVDATQHPRWTRASEQADGSGEGLRVFQNAVRYFR